MNKKEIEDALRAIFSFMDSLSTSEELPNGLVTS